MFRKWAHGLVIGLLLGSLFVAFPAAQNYVWSSINGVPVAPRILVGTGSLTTPSLGFAQEPNTGFYLYGTNTAALTINGVLQQAWYLSATYLKSDTHAIYFGAADDVVIGREAAATIQLGADVNGAAVDQLLKAHDGITGTDIAGADLTLAGGRGTGTGYPGAVNIQNGGILGTGTTAQTLATYATFHGKYQLFGTAADSHNLYHFEESLNFDATTTGNSAGYINIYSVPGNPYTMGTAYFRSLNIGNGKGTVIAYFDGTNGAFTVGATSGTGAGSLYAGAYYAGTTAGVDCTNALQVDTIKGIVTSCTAPAPDMTPASFRADIAALQQEIVELRGLLALQGAR